MKTAVKTELKPESNKNLLRFEQSKTDKEVSDVFFNDERIGDIGTNLTGLMKEYFLLYHETQLALQQTAPQELDKNQSLEQLKLLVVKNNKMAADIIIYQAGLKAFNGFRLIIQEPDTTKRFTMAQKLLKEVKSHLDLLIGQNVYVTEKNIGILKILVEKLGNMSNELENFKANSYITKVPGLEKLVKLYLDKKSKDGKTVANTFKTAIEFYHKEAKGECLVIIPSIKKQKKEEKKEKSKSKKPERTASSIKGFM